MQYGFSSRRSSVSITWGDAQHVGLKLSLIPLPHLLEVLPLLLVQDIMHLGELMFGVRWQHTSKIMLLIVIQKIPGVYPVRRFGQGAAGFTLEARIRNLARLRPPS